VITSASAGSGQTKTVIVLGDSTTNNGKVIEKLHENFASDVMSVTTLGTRGTTPNNHEGRSGWSWDTYFTKESVTYTDGRGTVYNPFYNPSTQTFDASYYFANSGISKPDFFIVNMGINDVFGFTSDSAYDSGVTTILERAETAVQSVLDATTTTKVCVCLTIPPNHSQDAFGKAYNCGQTRNRYKRNNTLWVDALMNLFKDRESERIYLIPINVCLDTIYNMGMETLPVNARNTDITYQSPISNGGVHPVESGYWQIADVYTAFIKANL
jgi:lysophospholipase L1-like esterase